MIKIDEIEIRSVNYKTLDNGACGVEVEWSTPYLTPNVKFNLYSLSYQNIKSMLKQTFFGFGVRRLFSKFRTHTLITLC